MADALVVGMSLALLVCFVLIWRYDQYLIQEPNILIRSSETAMLLAILCFGVYKLVIDFRARE